MTPTQQNLKTCSKCGASKSLTEFRAIKVGKWSGTRSECITCAKAAQKQWIAEHPDYTKEKWAAVLSNETPSQRQERLSRMSTYKKANRPLINDQVRNRYARDEAMREAKKLSIDKWRDKNPHKRKESGKRCSRRRRALKYKAEGHHTDEEFEALKATYGYRCVRCGRHESAEGFIKWERDHIIALSRGGPDWIYNIQPMCLPCNRKKSYSQHVDYRTEGIYLRVVHKDGTIENLGRHLFVEQP